jgi:phage portal protein BeeE
MSLLDRIIEPIAKRSSQQILNGLPSLKSIQKADSNALITPATQPGILRYTFDPVYINSNYYNKKKPDSTITFDVLRSFSLKYEIVRACINLRKRQLSGMEWDIVTAETSDTNDYTDDILVAKEFISQLGGTPDPTTGKITGGSYRKFMNMAIEDLMALDALALYRVRNNAGDLLTLLPVDGATIRLMISGMGSAPPPPAIAYKQVIRGTVTAELTTNDLIYDMMNPRTNSPYGLSPLESLMITVSAAMKSGMYNLAYLTDGNIPEGLIEAPEKWSATQIKEFEKNWNAALAGDDSATRQLHMLPAGANYTPTKKPNDMAFESFNEWLMRLTCTVYDVMPVEIGFPPKGAGLGDKGANQSQKETGNDKGLRPIANILEELMNNVIQDDLGLPHLKFSFQGLEVENLSESATINQTLIFSGQRTINEVRTDDGLDAIEGGDALFIVGQANPLNQEAIDAFGGLGKEDVGAVKHGKDSSDEAGGEADLKAEEADGTTGKGAPQFADDGSAGDSSADMTMSRKTDESFIRLVTEFRTLRKKVKTDFERGRTMKPFVSSVLPEKALGEINLRLAKSKTFEEADSILKEYRSDYQIEFLANVNKLRSSVQEILNDEQSVKTPVGAK